VSGRQHALGGGGRNITQQYAPGAQYGQEVVGGWHGRLVRGWEFRFNVVFGPQARSHLNAHRDFLLAYYQSVTASILYASNYYHNRLFALPTFCSLFISYHL
jgi:hypothetical protein